MTVTPKDVATFAVRVLTQYATMYAAAWLAGGVLSLLLGIVIGLLAATLAGDWFADTGYDLAVEGAGRALAFFRSFSATEAA